MDTHHFTHEAPACPCGAQLTAGHPALCRKCVARNRWTRRHQPRGSHTGTDRAIRTRRRRGGDA